MPKAEYSSAVRSRRLINHALADLLQKKQLDEITVTDVVKQAGISRGTFYVHYANVTDVADHLCQNAFSEIGVILSKRHCSREDLPVALLKQIQNLLESDLEFYRKIITSGSSSVIEDALIRSVVEYTLQHEEELYGGPHEHFILAVRFCAGGLCSLYHDWFVGNIPISLDELTDRAASLLKDVLWSEKTCRQTGC